jgi:hypothetical protein
MRKHTRFKYPRYCPLGHTQISWCIHEKRVFCWSCNREYAASQCHAVRAAVLSMRGEERYRPSYRSRLLVAVKGAMERVTDRHFVAMLAPIKKAIEKYLREHDPNWRGKGRAVRGFGR